MANFDKQAFDHLKKLARIDCTPEEESLILEKLQKILGFVGELEKVDIKDAKPCSFVLAQIAKNEWREDVPTDLMPREEFLTNAPDQIAGMIRVPPVMKSL